MPVTDSPRSLKGRTIAVVGAGTRPDLSGSGKTLGNGRAIALLAARQGAVVLCGDRDEQSAADTACRIEEQGGRANVQRVDVTSEDECIAFMTAGEQLGVDGLVLNVGVARGIDLVGTSLADWDLTLNVDLRGHFLLVREAMRTLPDGGSIVFISSISGLLPGTRVPAYDAAKAGLTGLCKHTALEGARRNIRANIVAPGMIDTPVGRAASHGRSTRNETPIPLQRQGSAWDVAHATTFLLSDDASYITGQTLAVDGGLSLSGLARL